MMVFHYLQLDPALSAAFDEADVTVQAVAPGPEAAHLWQTIKAAAQQAAQAGAK